MSQRTLVELNHDFCPGRATQSLAEWAGKMRVYMGSGDPRELPYGVTFKSRRHHSDAEPMTVLGVLRWMGRDLMMGDVVVARIRKKGSQFVGQVQDDIVTRTEPFPSECLARAATFEAAMKALTK